jgi:hypothetical protein
MSASEPVLLISGLIIVDACISMWLGMAIGNYVEKKWDAFPGHGVIAVILLQGLLLCGAAYW